MTDTALPRHAPMTVFPVVGDELVLGGVPLTRLAARIGSTPFYAYDRKVITRTVEALRQCLPAEIRVHYAVKANPMPAVVQHLARLVDGADVASAKEMRIALDAGVSSDNISFAGPGKNDGEIRAAIAAGIVINLESEGECERVIVLAAELGMTPRVAIRVNPDFELKTSGMKMGGGAKPFGVDVDRVPALVRRVCAARLDFHGFQVFSGSQNLRVDAIVEAQGRTLELASRLAKESRVQLKTLNIGGGFGIPYFPGDVELDLAKVGSGLTDHLHSFKAQLAGVRVNIELGRYIVGPAGIYVCRIIDRKVSRGQVFLVTDGGMHHHLAASGNFGQVIRKNYPVAIGNRMKGEQREVASVVGPLCTPLDLLADRMELAKATVGDLVVVFQSGAYGLTASPVAFLGHPPPLEALV